MKNLKEPTGQVARWLQILSTYDLTVIHRPGSNRKNEGNGDALSRTPCKACVRQEALNIAEDVVDQPDEIRNSLPTTLADKPADLAYKYKVSADKVATLNDTSIELANQSTYQAEKKVPQQVNHNDQTVRVITRSKQNQDSG